MVTELIVKGLIKPRGRLADIALLILDESDEIQSLSRSFFIQFGSEGNQLLNQLPDILANLHKDELVESDFRQISEFLFEQFTSKEKQMELMVQSLCARFKEKGQKLLDHTFRSFEASFYPVIRRMILRSGLRSR